MSEQTISELKELMAGMNETQRAKFIQQFEEAETDEPNDHPPITRPRTPKPKDFKISF